MNSIKLCNSSCWDAPHCHNEYTSRMPWEHRTCHDDQWPVCKWQSTMNKFWRTRWSFYQCHEADTAWSRVDQEYKSDKVTSARVTKLTVKCLVNFVEGTGSFSPFSDGQVCTIHTKQSPQLASGLVVTHRPRTERAERVHCAFILHSEARRDLTTYN